MFLNIAFVFCYSSFSFTEDSQHWGWWLCKNTIQATVGSLGLAFTIWSTPQGQTSFPVLWRAERLSCSSHLFLTCVLFTSFLPGLLADSRYILPNRLEQCTSFNIFFSVSCILFSGTVCMFTVRVNTVGLIFNTQHLESDAPCQCPEEITTALIF